MKKLFFIAAIASVAFASCVKNEVAPTAQQEITFEAPIVGNATKVDLITTYPTTSTFGVYALYYAADWTGYNDGSAYMSNVEVTHEAPAGGDADGGWVANGYYWPKQTDATLTFAAYSPYMSSGVSHDAKGISFTNYVVADADVDLLFSERTYNQKPANQIVNNSSIYYGVNIHFNHALSAIVFQAKAADGLTGNTAPTPNYEFKITKIEVLDVKNKGSFSQGIIDGASNPTTPAASTTDWTIAGDAVNTNYTAYTGSGITVNSTTPISAYGADPAGKADLILIPQSLASVKVRVTYDMRHSNMATGTWVEGNVSEANLSYDDTDDSKDVTSWLRGKRYVYTLTLGLDEIYFAPSISNWDNVTVAGSQVL